MDELAPDELRACEWLGRWVVSTRSTWNGPDAVVLRARRLVIELRTAEEPIEVTTVPGEHFRLRIAPMEAPPFRLEYEPDDEDRVRVHAVVHVPPSLALTP